MRARELMTSPVVTVGPDAPVKDAARLLVTHGFAVLPVVDADDRLLGVERHLRAVPAVDRDRLVGIVSRVDVLRTVVRDDDAIARDVTGHLSAAGRRLWDVAVTDGVVSLASEGADETDRHIATVVAGCAPGVVGARIPDEVAHPARP